MNRHAIAAALLASGLLRPPSVLGQMPLGVTFEPSFGTAIENRFRKPVAMEAVPGFPGAFMVLEQGPGSPGDSGKIWLLEPEAEDRYRKRLLHKVLVPPTYGGDIEHGLLGIAFHPRFRENGRYFINYNPTEGRSVVLEERRFDAATGMDAGKSRVVLVRPATTGHNGGTLAFGPDGFLYISTGDIGNWEFPQRRYSLSGKILRIDVDGGTDEEPYRIPADNPFQDDGERGEIYAMGLRNPWKFSFDPLTGDLWAGDVGNRAFEEVNRIRKGANYGYPWKEGNADGPGPVSCASPVCFDPNTQFAGEAVIGGYVYRGNPSSPYYGHYFFGDFALSGAVYAFPVDGKLGDHARVGSLGTRISSFARDEEGNLYVLGYETGIVYHLRHPGLEIHPAGIRKATAPKRLRVSGSLPPWDGRGPVPDVRRIDGRRSGAWEAGPDGLRRFRASEPGLYLYRGPEGYALEILSP